MNVLNRVLNYYNNIFNIIVREFAKYTGDLGFLSPVDIKVLALQLQLEKEYVGTSHLRFAPKV